MGDMVGRLNAELGAFVRVRAAEAAAEAQAVDARADRAELPLAGVPVAVKDCVPVAGAPMSYGSAAEIGRLSPWLRHAPAYDPAS